MNVHTFRSHAILVTASLLAAAAVHAQGAAPPSTISFVAGNTTLSAADQTIVNRLAGFGHTVVVHDDDGITVAATAGSDAVMISSTSSSTRILTTFKGDLRPIIVWESALYDDFGMTGLLADVDYGWQAGQIEIDLVAANPPIGNGLSLGPVAVTSTAQEVAWGVPGGAAAVVATVLGDAARATLFTFGQGDELADGGFAAGKRAALYLSDTSASVWAAEGMTLFDQVLEWALVPVPAAPTIVVPPYPEYVVEGATATFSVVAGGHPAPSYQWKRNGVDLAGETADTLTLTATPADLATYTVEIGNSEGAVTSAPAWLTLVEPRTFSFVVGNTNLNAADLAAAQKLTDLGHTVVTHDDSGISVAATLGSDAVLISESVSFALVGATFAADLRPVVIWETSLYPDMGFTGAQEDVHFGALNAQTQIEFIDVTTPIASNFALGPAAVTSSLQTLGWGVPGGEATISATVAGDLGRATVFTYDQGATLFDGSTAAGKRIAFYPRSASTSAWTALGEQLFEQAITSAFGPLLSHPAIVTQPEDETVVEGSTANFSVVANGNPPPTYQWQYQGSDLPGETGASLSFTATFADVGEYRVVVTNSQGSVVSDAAMLTVLPGNRAPSFSSVPVVDATQGLPYTYDVSATDPDAGDTLSFTAIQTPSWLAFVDNGDGTAVLSGTPGPGDVGVHGVTLEVRDASGLTDSQGFAVTVADANDAPAFSSTPLTTINEGSFYGYSIATSDADVGDTRTISALALPGWLALVDNGDGTGLLRGTPAQAQVGNHAVELEVVDVAGARDTQAFTITVANVEFSPTFTSRPVTAVTEGQAYRYGIVAADADGDPVTLRAGTLPAWITFTNNGDGTGELLGFPAGVDIGTHSAELFAEDDTGTTVASQTFSIVVNAAADAPVIVINGNPQVVVRQGERFDDPGATAMDPQDGDLTDKITVFNPVDPRVLGRYTVLYSVQDTAGNESQAQRSVVVQRQVDGGGGSLGWLDVLGLSLLAAAAGARRRRGREAPSRLQHARISL